MSGDISAIELALLKKGSGGNEAVSIGENGELLSNGDPLTKYRISLRSPTRGGERAQSTRAKNLQKCKGLKGCEFAQCALDALGKLPPNLVKSCPTLQK